MMLLYLLLLLLPSSFWSPVAGSLEQGAVLQELLHSRWITKPLPTWVSGTDPCVANWEAVDCSAATGVVITLNLSHCGLNGSVPATLGRLSSLRALDLSNNKVCYDCGPWNNVKGDLAALSTLTNLETLALTSNELSVRNFPAAILNLTKLVNLRLDNTLIRGVIPAEIGSLSNLQYLYLGNNSFTTPVPWGAFGSMLGLRNLSMWGTPLSSACPPELGKLSNLTVLNLNRCGLYGGLPPEYGQLTKLETLLLYKNDLTGPIPDTWRSLNNLTSFFVYQNSLHGEVPAWVLELPSLVTFEISSNYFYGPIQPSVLNKNSTPALQFLHLGCNFLSGARPNVSGNISVEFDFNCFDTEPIFNYSQPDSSCDRRQSCLDFYLSTNNGICPDCPENQQLVNASTCICSRDYEGRSKKKSSTIIIIASTTSITIGGVVLVFFVILGCLIKRLRRQSTMLKDIQKEFAKRDVQPYLYSYSELKVATQDFNVNLELGVGGYGVVYKGVLNDKSIVAIKRLKTKTDQALQDFLNEIVTISSIKHRNLVQLKGCCIKGDEKFLIYEFVENKNLAEALWDCTPNKRLQLDWSTRFKIIIGVARGLLYLHEDVQPAIIHRDIKPPNILLDNNLNAKIADFGLALLFPELVDDQTHQSLTKVAGTRGYLAPEYAAFGQVSTKVDIFSYGILILEIVSGRKNIDLKKPIAEHYLFDWAQELQGADRICDLIDVAILDTTIVKDDIKRVLNVALLCIHYVPAKRPSMSQVLNMLLNNIEIPNIPYKRNNFNYDTLEVEMNSMTSSTLERESSSLVSISMERSSEVYRI